MKPLRILGQVAAFAFGWFVTDAYWHVLNEQPMEVYGLIVAGISLIVMVIVLVHVWEDEKSGSV